MGIGHKIKSLENPDKRCEIIIKFKLIENDISFEEYKLKVNNLKNTNEELKNKNFEIEEK
jgi:hypothetical protein